ncbi:RNA polymerase sigma factor [Actinocorallia lasiicapitis]
MTALTISDAEALTGDHPYAFAVLFDRYAGMLHRYATRRLGPEAADDVVNETFLVAFQRRNTFDPAYPDARPWLFGILTRLISRHHRSESAHLRAFARLTVETDDFPADDIADRVSAHGARAEIARALARLNRGERDVLLLTTWAELNYEQTAEALGVAVGTVRSRLNRARTKLRKSLKGADTWTT